MRIVFLVDWFSEKMGYAENCMPKALAAMGHDVHVVTSTAQVYATSEFYREVYEPYLGPPYVEPQTVTLDGFTLHRLPINKDKGELHIEGLRKALCDLRPQIVQTYDVLGYTTTTAVLAKPFLGFKLFTANHVVASVFPLFDTFSHKDWRYRLRYRCLTTLKGKVISLFTSKCYPATVDAADIAMHFWGVPKRKIRIDTLGVDTSLFHPVCCETDESERAKIRKKLGVNCEDILCVYTGRFTEGKNPLRLAEAIGQLRAEEKPFKAIFLGSGIQEAEIKGHDGVITHPFVSFKELSSFYRAADIGVWPQQESTSMLDAAACGLPIVVSDRVKAVERVDGNGLMYKEGCTADLARTLKQLESPIIRSDFGRCGVEKTQKISWNHIAKQRFEDYVNSLGL